MFIRVGGFPAATVTPHSTSRGLLYTAPPAPDDADTDTAEERAVADADVDADPSGEADDARPTTADD